jgi:hypothetical protein
VDRQNFADLRHFMRHERRATSTAAEIALQHCVYDADIARHGGACEDA